MSHSQKSKKEIGKKRTGRERERERDIKSEREGGLHLPTTPDDNEVTTHASSPRNSVPVRWEPPGRPGTQAAPCASFLLAPVVFFAPDANPAQTKSSQTNQPTNQHHTQQPGLRCWKMTTLSPYVKTNELNSKRAH